MNTHVESKVAEVITRSTLVKETENHIFKIINYDNKASNRFRGSITHKNGTRCGDFSVSLHPRKALQVNINMDCRDLLADLLAMLDDIDANNIVEVDEFNYVKEAANVTETETETPAEA